MNIRESILIKLEEDLPDLQSLNGYELNYNTIVKGYISVSDCKNFPTVCYDLSSVSSASAGETVQQNLNTSRLIIWIYVSEFKEKGKAARVFLKTTFGDKIRITRGLHTSATDAANLRHLRHFNAVDIDGNTYHVYCRGVDAHFRIVSFTKIVTTLFQ